MKEEEVYMKLFQYSRPTFFKWKREKIPVMQLLAKYFAKEELEEFVEKGFIAKFEKFEDYKIDPVFENYVLTKLKRDNNLESFIAQNLKQFQKYSLDNLTVANAKEKFIDFLSSVHLLKFLRSKKEEMIEDIDKFADIEAYLILKYPEKFIS
ncbi:MAG: hypothetical protein PHS42_08170 [Sulfurimonas sp.]|nr:hypothetical protein [Sulfurimonas sp.]MDD3835435.1 hypothetical protein [Sulfurimonas sp.]MDY0196143.1 hypothetical protein [Sulfurovaceae bacterium]